MSTDREAIAASLDHPEQFAVVFERYATRIYRYAAGRVGVDAAEDVMSEVFVVAFQRRERFDPEWESCGPWLFGIATTLIRRRRADEARALRAFEASSGSFAEGERSDDVTAERVDAERRLAALGPAIAALSRGDRDVLLLYAWGELDYRGVSEALGIPVGTVRSRLNRARRKLTAAEGDLAPAVSSTTKEGWADGRLGRGAPTA